jgi:antitoxin VapB
METGLKIESDEASALASELAELTGESVDAAITKAIRERLNREREKAAKVKRMLELGAEIRAHMTGPVSSSDPDEFYDADGLPR